MLRKPTIAPDRVSNRKRLNQILQDCKFFPLLANKNVKQKRNFGNVAEPEAEAGGILLILVAKLVASLSFRWQQRGNNPLVSCILRVNTLTGAHATNSQYK